MIIQHNVANMTAVRNNEINSVKMGKSLEKISSGNKINRSGDDAAGLAVSEKMRAQISGMKQSLKNCQDGISLIQTFEGALGESVTVIKRLRGLAVQSANGIYDDQVDRSAIEIEFRTLCDEVDQLADTDFNGLVMLNGGQMADGYILSRAGNAAFSQNEAQYKIPDTIGYDSYSADFDDEKTKMSLEFMPGVAGRSIDRETYMSLKDMDMADIKVRLNNGVPEFSFDKGYENISIRTDPNDIYSGILSVNKKDGSVFDVAKVNLPIYHNAFVRGFGQVTQDHTVHHPSTNGAGYFSCSIGIVVKTETNHAKEFDAVKKCCEAGRDGINFIGGINGKLTDPRTGSTITYADLESEFGIHVNRPKCITEGSLVNVNGRITMNTTLNGTAVTIPDNGYSIARYAYVNGSTSGFSAHRSSLAFDGANWIDTKTNQHVTELDGWTASLASAPNAGDTLDLSVSITKEQYFDGKYYEEDFVNADFDLEEPNVDFSKTTDGNIYYYNGSDWTIYGTKQTVNIEDEGINYPPDKIADWFEGLKIEVHNDTNYVDGGTINASVDLFSNPATYSVPNAFHVAYEGLTYADNLTLQTNARSKDAVNFTFQYAAMGIGSLTADLNCTSVGLGLDKLSAATQKSANEAIDQCSYALNKVMMVRSTFGAAQNRLEVKMTTLNNTVINLTDAESRIRNINVADEMMSFSQNRIVSEASQAMLAQAKNIPQQAVDLLGGSN